MVILKNQFHMAFFATALVITLSVFLYTLLQKRTDRPQNKWFLVVLCIIGLNSVAELFTAVLEPFVISNYAKFIGMAIAQNIYFLFHNALCPALYAYVSTVTGINRRRSKLRTFLLHIPFAFTAIMVVLNPIFNWIFYYDNNLQFHRNWGEYLIYAAAVFYFALSVFQLLFSWNAITPRRSAALSYLFLLTFVGVLVQFINIDIKSELFAEALALMGAMIAIESEDDRIDADTGIYNRRALHMDIHNLLSLKDGAELIFVKVHNASLIERVSRSADYDVFSVAVTDFLKTLVPRYDIYLPNKDCFIIMCKVNEHRNVEELVKRITARFNTIWQFYGNSFKLDASVLHANLPDEIKTYEDVVYIADCIIPSHGINDKNAIKWIMRRADIESAIKKCLTDNGFEVYYQPTLCVDGRTIHGAEALVRMNSSDVGSVLPEEFIPIAERIGLVDDIDDFVLSEVCKLIKSGILQEKHMDSINVNLSVIQCLKPGFFKHILNIIDAYEIDHSLINFEITESVGPDDYQALSKVTHQLKAAGFNLSMDDYGTGYSNVDGIFSLDFDVVKIDKSILWGAEKEDRGRIILENSIRMIHGLGCKVLVEGVETEEQLSMLQSYGVDYLQGFHFSKPLPKDSFISYINSGV